NPMRTLATVLGVAAAALLGTVAARSDAGGKEAAGKVVQPFNGRDLTGWKTKGPKDRSKWVVGRASLDEQDPKKLRVVPLAPEADGGPGARELINASSGVDLYTEEKFGDCTIDIEF